MGKSLEAQFSFYASYHSNTVNQWIHIFCVWPILWTALVFLAYTASIDEYIPLKYATMVPTINLGIKINFCLLAAIRYMVFYSYIEQPGIAGIIAAVLVFLGYLFAESIVAAQPEIWKPALAIHIFSWFAQFYGHGIHEKRAPALFDNLNQALSMAPLFVLMEVMFKFGYKKEFKKKIDEIARENIKKFNAEVQKNM